MGKTSVGRAFALSLARRGKKVLAIDLDQQANLTRSLLGYGWESSVGDRDAGDLFASSPAYPDVRDIVLSVATNLDLIPGKKDDLFRIERELEIVHGAIADEIVPSLEGLLRAEGDSVPKASLEAVVDRLRKIEQENLNWQKVLKKRISPLFPEYDYVIIDLPPSVSRIPINAWVASQYLLVPVSDTFAVDGTGNLVKYLSDIIREYNQDIRFVFFFNKVRTGRNQHGTFETRYSNSIIGSFMNEVSANPVIAAVSQIMSSYIPFSLDVENANSDDHSKVLPPGSTIAQAVEDFTDELEGILNQR